jgi:Ca2+-binding RTX toxin-like protein
MTYFVSIDAEMTRDFNSNMLFPQTLNKKPSGSFLSGYDDATSTYSSGYISYNENGHKYRIEVWGSLTDAAHNDITGDVSEADVKEWVNGRFVNVGSWTVGRNILPGRISVHIASVASLTLDSLIDDAAKLGTTLSVLTGREGNDKLYGNDADNFIQGWTGNDVLVGRGGKDDFIFEHIGKANADHITDFAHGQDKIDIVIDGDGPFLSLSGDIHPRQIFHDITNAAEDKNDRILYDSSTGVLSFDDDGSGHDKAIVFAHLDNHAKLDYHDFDF